MDDLVPSRDRQALVRHRKCIDCHVVKPLNETCFGRSIHAMTGFKGRCLKCEKRMSK